MGDFIQQASDWAIAMAQQSGVWGVVIVFVLAFGESLAFISLLLPATVIFFALGALIGKADLPFWPLWAAVRASSLEKQLGEGGCLHRTIASLCLKELI